MLFFFEHHGLDLQDLFQVNYLQTRSFPAHLHRAYELILVRSGTLNLQVEQKQYFLKEKDLAFVFCNQIHSFTASAESDIVIVLFSPELIGDFYSEYKERIPANNVIHLDALPAFDHFSSVYDKKSVLYQICGQLLSTTSLELSESKSQVVILQKIFAYVDKHFGEECSLKTVSQSMKYDYVYLSKLFTRLTGMHFTEYLNQYRISQACYLLKKGVEPISEIAIQCGYVATRTFHRNFQSIIGCSPKEYIAQL